ncbi:MAG: DEAD/DEAH box helicase [Eubacteriales bacterium]|nr:DEAD/DEAH box helicase [Eubacteriales bacterium]
MDIFSRYAPFIQDYIYENGWESLRAVQAAAGDAIFNTDKNVLICASTASGKTEAAFFPVLTELYENPPASVGVIYVAPLKALINDQFERLDYLCRGAEIPVWRWHGDVSASHKRKMLRYPSGVLQITPESLESMLLHRHAAIPKLFGDLRFVIIDEIHSLMRGDRGAQTICLIERLSRLVETDPRRIGLSATIGDPEAAGRFLAAGTKRGTVIPRIEEKGQVWRLSMEHFFTTGPQAADPSYRDSYMEGSVSDGGLQCAPVEQIEFMTPSAASDSGAVDAQVVPAINIGGKEAVKDSDMLPEISPASDTAPSAADPGAGYIFEHTRGRKCLVFCNSREEAEAVTTTLRQYCDEKGEPDRFLIHHGNLSASIRQSAEEDMKDENLNLTTVTTATLELGIDIGKLERAFQINAPFTVSAFLQRMGRTGRRGMPPEMWFVMREEPPLARAMMPDCIPWELIQGVALVQLYIEERWVETARPGRLPYSLLYHQTMSTLAAGGEMTPARLASRILTLSMFSLVSQDDYRMLLNHLIEIDHIELTERGGLIVGLAGERVVNNFKFYAVFQDNEEYTVRSESQEIGTLVAPPPAGEKVAIAGHVWVVDEIDRKRHIIYCTMVKGKVPAYFGDVAGDINTRILERMADVLREKPDKMYPYLMKNASVRLMKARKMARSAGITDRPLRCLGGSMWVLFPWLGSYAFLALERFLRLVCGDMLGIKGFDPRRPYYMIFTMQASEQEFYKTVTHMAERGVNPMELLYPREVPSFDKYDEFLPDELVRKGFAYGVLETGEMLDRVLGWKKFIECRLPY